MNHPGPAAPAQPPSRRWLWWVGGGCGGAVLLVVVLVVVAVVVIVRHTSSSGCLPEAFPVQPGMTRVQAYDVAGGCTTIFRTQSGAASVRDFYLTQLDRNGWQVLSRRGALIEFQRRARPQEAGEVQVQNAAGARQVTIAITDH